MTEIITKKEAVEKYGSDACKRHFLKYGKFKNTSIEQALLKTLRQYYEYVEIKKEGRSFVYVLEGKRAIPTVRDDKRQANGMMKETTKDINLAVASFLDEYEIDGSPRSLLSWLYKFELITSKQLNVFQINYDKTCRAMILEELIENKIIGVSQSQILIDYSLHLNSLKGSMGECLKRLEKIGAIELIEYYTGVYATYKIKDDGSQANDASNVTKEIVGLRREEIKQYIDSSTYLELENEKALLRKSHNLKEFTIRVYPHSAKVKSYNEEVENLYSNHVIKEYGDTYTLDFYYKSYSIVVKEKGKVLQYYCDRIQDNKDRAISLNAAALTNLVHTRNFRSNFAKETEQFALKKEMINREYFKKKTEIVWSEEIRGLAEEGWMTEEEISEIQQEQYETFYRYADKEYYDYSLAGEYHKKIMAIHNYYFEVVNEPDALSLSTEDNEFYETLEAL